VLRVEEVERAVPKDDAMLIKVRASTVTQTDTHAPRADLFLWRFVLGLRRPRARTLGVELAGVVEAIGAAVSEFKAVVDRRYSMEQVVEAHRYVETWHKAGNVVLAIATD
jgi:NADPH:quinone reductase-like Zn-dependent oxidoreductase